MVCSPETKKVLVEELQFVKSLDNTGGVKPEVEYPEVFQNRQRLHSTLGHRSPVRFLEPWISQAGKTGSMNPTLGKTNNRGKLIQTDILDADASQIVADLWKPRNALQGQQNVEKCGN